MSRIPFGHFPIALAVVGALAAAVAPAAAASVAPDFDVPYRVAWRHHRPDGSAGPWREALAWRARLHAPRPALAADFDPYAPADAAGPSPVPQDNDRIWVLRPDGPGAEVAGTSLRADLDRDGLPDLLVVRGLEPQSGPAAQPPLAAAPPAGTTRPLVLQAARRPSGPDLAVDFVLPAAGPARLALYDVRGRLVHARDVGALGPGAHRMVLGAHLRLAPGVYTARLTQAGASAATRMVVLP